MKGSFLTFMGMIVLMMTGCTSKNTTVGDIVADNITNAVSQYSLMTDQIEKSGHILNPRTLDENGEVVYVPYDDWKNPLVQSS